MSEFEFPKNINPLMHEMLRHFKRTGYGDGPCGGIELADYGEAYEKLVTTYEALLAAFEELRRESELSIVDNLVNLFRLTDTPALIDICGEDEWITHQRNIYHDIKKHLDDDVPLRRLLENAIARRCKPLKEKEARQAEERGR